MLVTSKDYARLLPTLSWEAVRKRYQRMKDRLRKRKGQYLSVDEIAAEEGIDAAEVRRAIFPRRGE